jgi:hypothetical protein
MKKFTATEKAVVTSMLTTVNSIFRTAINPSRIPSDLRSKVFVANLHGIYEIIDLMIFDGDVRRVAREELQEKMGTEIEVETFNQLKSHVHECVKIVLRGAPEGTLINVSGLTM